MYQGYINEYETLKHKFEISREQLLDTMEDEMVSPHTYVNAIANLIQIHLQELETKSSSSIGCSQRLSTISYSEWEWRIAPFVRDLDPAMGFLQSLDYGVKRFAVLEKLLTDAQKKSARYGWVTLQNCSHSN